MGNIQGITLPNSEDHIFIDGTLWEGHKADWDALSAAEQAKYRYVSFDDDGDGTDEAYRVVATSTANTTYRAQMAELYNAVKTLSERDLFRSALLVNNAHLLRFGNIVNARYCYSNIVVDTGGTSILSCRFYENNNYIYIYDTITTATSAVVAHDSSTDNNAGDIKLIIID